MKKLVATVSGVGAALAVTCVGYCPSAVAGPACPYDMSTAAGQQALVDATVAASNQVRSDEASIGPTGNQAVADKDRQIEADNTGVILACSGKASPASSQAIANADQSVANDEAAARQQAADRAAMNAPEPGVLANGQPDCGYYQAQVDSMPKPVQLGFLAMPKALDPQNVVLTCGLGDSVIGGVDLATGNIPGFISGSQQAERAFCNTGRNLLPIRLPAAC